MEDTGDHGEYQNKYSNYGTDDGNSTKLTFKLLETSIRNLICSI